MGGVSCEEGLSEDTLADYVKVCSLPLSPIYVNM